MESPLLSYEAACLRIKLHAITEFGEAAAAQNALDLVASILGGPDAEAKLAYIREQYAAVYNQRLGGLG